jgi:hypothetical protein
VIDDLQESAADELFVLDERDVGLDAGRVAVHHEGDRAGRRKNGDLRVLDAVDLGLFADFVPGLARRGEKIERHLRRRDLVGRAAVLAENAEHRLAVRIETFERL